MSHVIIINVCDNIEMQCSAVLWKEMRDLSLVFPVWALGANQPQPRSLEDQCF